MQHIAWSRLAYLLCRLPAPGLAQEQEFPPENQEPLLALMRTKGLSIKELDDKQKEELRQFLEYLHVTKGMSLTDVAKLIGN